MVHHWPNDSKIRDVAHSATAIIEGMSTTHHFTVVDTAIGHCGIAWGAHGIVAVQLPGDDAGRTRARLLRRCSDVTEAAPPAGIQQVIDAIVTLLGGTHVDLSAAPLDMARVDEFGARVYAIARQIPPGQTLTYGEIATRLGDRLLAQDVGQALGRNPFPIIVPCHRVLAAGGKAGGFSAPGGVNTKLRLLAIEGAPLPKSSTRSLRIKEAAASYKAAQLGLFDGA